MRGGLRITLLAYSAALSVWAVYLLLTGDALDAAAAEFVGLYLFAVGEGHYGEARLRNG